MISSFFISCGHLSGTPLSRFIGNFAILTATNINLKCAESLGRKSSNAEVLKGFSSLIKAYYRAKGRLPVEALKEVEAFYNREAPQNEKKTLFELLSDYKEGEKALVDKLIDVFYVAAALVRSTYHSEKPLKLGFFSLLNECEVSHREKDLYFIAWRSAGPIYGENSIWKEEDFIEIVTYVFFAILPDVPDEYTLPEESEDYDSDDSVGHGLSPQQELKSETAVSSTSRSPQGACRSSQTSSPQPQLGIVDSVMAWFGYYRI